MAVTGFEVGKYYKWTGSKKDLDNWAEQMNAMLDGLPHKCTEVVRSHASFDGVCGGPWYWGHVLDRITEVKKGDGGKIASKEITASEARRLVAGGTECQWYDDDSHTWNDCEDNCAYQIDYKYRRKPTVPSQVLQGGIVGLERSGKIQFWFDALPEPKKPIKERRRDIRKRFLGL